MEVEVVGNKETEKYEEVVGHVGGNIEIERSEELVVYVVESVVVSREGMEDEDEKQQQEEVGGEKGDELCDGW